MAKPSTNEIAAALGIAAPQVVQLSNRGMPTNKIKKAREWFDQHGFASIHHGKSGGAANQGPHLTKQVNLAKASGLSEICPASRT